MRNSIFAPVEETSLKVETKFGRECDFLRYPLLYALAGNTIDPSRNFAIGISGDFYFIFFRSCRFEDWY